MHAALCPMQDYACDASPQCVDDWDSPFPEGIMNIRVECYSGQTVDERPDQVLA